MTSFSVDGSAPRQQPQSGNNGTLTGGRTTLELILILYWTKMDLLHYPGAGETKAYLEKKQEQMHSSNRSAAAESNSRRTRILRKRISIESLKGGDTA